MSTNASGFDQPRPRLRWRFTIAGLMVAILGIAVALATTRLPGARWFDGFLGAFLVWYTIGCWSQAAALIRSARDASSEDAWTIRFAIGARGLAPMIVACGMALHFARRSGVVALSSRLNDFAFPQLIDFLSTGLIVLPVLTLLAPLRSIAARRGGIRGIVSGLFEIVAGVGLCLLVGANLIMITVLVHLAVHGVRQYQPLRRLGVQIEGSSYDADTIRIFCWGAVAAVILWVAALAILSRLARGQTTTSASARWQRAALATMLAVTMTSLAVVIAAGGWLFGTQISPFLGQSVWTGKPPFLWGVALLFLATASWWMTGLLLRAPGESAAAIRLHLPSAPFWHDRPLVLCLPVLWLASNWIDTIQSNWPLAPHELAELFLGDITSLLLLAFGLSWVQLAWHYWKGYDASCLELSRVSPWRAVAVCLGCAMVIAAGGPVAAWINFVLWTWPT